MLTCDVLRSNINITKEGDYHVITVSDPKLFFYQG